MKRPLPDELTLPIKPCGKACFKTKKDALTARNFYQLRCTHNRRARPARLGVYHCPDCEAWHLRSEEEKERMNDVRQAYNHKSTPPRTANALRHAGCDRIGEDDAGE